MSLSVRWGEHELSREFLPLGQPRAYTVGTAAGVDFVCGGARALELIRIDADGAKLSGASLEKGASQQLKVGALVFEAQLVDRPPQVKRKASDGELAVVNIGLVCAAVFGVFAVAAANAAAEGFAMDDELAGAPTQAVKVLFRQQERQQQLAASTAAAAPRMTKDKQTPPNSPNAHARHLPPSRPTGKPSNKVDVGSLFQGPGVGAVFASSGLGNDLKVASSGLRTADSGSGVGILGTGKGMDGNGLGGLGLQGIGALGTKGGRGPGDPFGKGVMLTKKEGPAPEIPIVPLEDCTSDGNGCLDKELIRKVIRANLAGFRYCYESRLNAYPNLEGKVAVRFTIAQSGRVVAADLASSTANNPDLERCVADRTRLLQFPASKWTGLVRVTYPFIFKQSGR